MSSRDFGPSLPPHLKRSQHHSDRADVKSHSSPIQRRHEGRKERYSDKHRDYKRERDRGVETTRRKRTGDRYDERKRDDYLHERTDHELNKKNDKRARRRQTGSDKITSDQPASLSKHSKRSKSDRTYNTDTEESSDDDERVKQWMKIKNKKVLVTSEPSSSESADEMHSSINPDHVSSGRSSDNLNTLQKESSPSGFVMGEMGPALPPHLIPESVSSRVLDASSNFQVLECGHDQIPQIQHKKAEESVYIGGKRNNSSGDAQAAESGVPMGPILPAHLQEVSTNKSNSTDTYSVIGPVLPPHLQNVCHNPDNASSFDEKQDSVDRNSVVGPAVPPGLKHHEPELPSSSQAVGESSSSEISDDEVVGPLLPGEVMRSRKNYMVQSQLERNAAAVKDSLEGKVTDLVGSVQREEWMIELPPEGAVDLGLGPRSFRVRGAPEKGADRSIWTDTPAEKAKKEEEARKKEFEHGMSSSSGDHSRPISRELSRRDQFMEEVVKKHSKKRSKESLLEAHQKKLHKEKKKKEESGVKQERRPFNRETDLKTNVFDDAQKKSIFKKAQFLNSRFSAGESKYL